MRPLAVVGIVAFALAFGHVEAAVVTYIRLAIGGTLDPTASVDPLSLGAATFPWQIEVSREAATLVMLAGVALAVARSWRDRIVVFLFAFALWDAQYYLSLRLLTGWPESLDAQDVYFLIPIAWTGPVWLPLLIDVVIVVFTIGFWQRKAQPPALTDPRATRPVPSKEGLSGGQASHQAAQRR